ncbi:hypothetical protein HMPREF1869_01223 [Bacteroidales bacterium KA00251]|nr:hypothetical protein HMPREF1869_01223 [Bacteroidales bacterium KA00251]
MQELFTLCVSFNELQPQPLHPIHPPFFRPFDWEIMCTIQRRMKSRVTAAMK